MYSRHSKLYQCSPWAFINTCYINAMFVASHEYALYLLKTLLQRIVECLQLWNRNAPQGNFKLYIRRYLFSNRCRLWKKQNCCYLFRHLMEDCGIKINYHNYKHSTTSCILNMTACTALHTHYTLPVNNKSASYSSSSDHITLHFPPFRLPSTSISVRIILVPSSPKSTSALGLVNPRKKINRMNNSTQL